MILTVVLTFVALSSSAVNADSLRHWGGSLSVIPSKTVGLDEYARKFLKKKDLTSIEARVGYTALPSDSDAFASDYNYPTVSAGLRYGISNVSMHREKDSSWPLLEPVDYTSHLGNIVSAYATFARPIIRTRHWDAGYSLSMGVAYSHKKYSAGDNVDDELIGSRWLIYFGASAYATYHFSGGLGLRAAFEFYHHSNGALNRPNKGANYVGPSIGVVYEPQHEQLAADRGRIRQAFNPYSYLYLSLGIGAKTLNEDWQLTQFNVPPEHPDYRRARFHAYPTYAFSAAVMRRYARRWASGAGIDLFYGTYSDHIAELDADTGERHSPFSAGLSARHSVFYHAFSLDMALGYYFFRRMGANAKEVEKPYYEHIGLHYTIAPLNHLTIGVNVKAHLTKADYTEFVISYPIRLTR